ncbi:MAG: NAD(P)H-dependent glycerol-3-phosphate dehydrogenase [Calditrichaeota bacterium]|nr:NAD(P)H-dependent glycerol-3-phosphate dehydrogenase [Calditrichota bacterium]
MIGLVGLGNMGSAIAHVMASNGHAVLGWEHNARVVEEINRNHTNTPFLPGITLDPNLKATGDLKRVFETCPVIFVAIPSIFFQSVLKPFSNKTTGKVFVDLTKGIDRETLLTSFQMLQILFPGNQHVMLSGPSIANEFSRGLPTLVMLAGEDKSGLLQIARILENDYFRVRFSDDTIGVELGGILKNIYAIGLGIFDGLAIDSVNFRSSYLTVALEEISQIGVALGARKETFLYLAGMGDLLATSLSQHSHNRRMGEFLAQGLSLKKIEQKMGVLPEGFNTLKMTLYLAEKHHCSMPLARGLWDVIHERLSAETFVQMFIKDFVE